LKDYGIGVDCHSRFYQVCLRVRKQDGGFQLTEVTVPANVEQLVEAFREGRIGREAYEELMADTDARLLDLEA